MQAVTPSEAGGQSHPLLSTDLEGSSSSQLHQHRQVQSTYGIQSLGFDFETSRWPWKKNTSSTPPTQKSLRRWSHQNGILSTSSEWETVKGCVLEKPLRSSQARWTGSNGSPYHTWGAKRREEALQWFSSKTTCRRRPELSAKPNAMPGKIRLSMQYKVIYITLGRGKDSLKMKFQPVNAIKV